MLLFFWSPLTVKFRCLGRGFLCAAQISCSHFASLFVVFKEGSSVLHKLAAVTLHRYSSSLKRVPLCRAKLQSICTVEFECAVGFFFFFSLFSPSCPAPHHPHPQVLALAFPFLCRFVSLCPFVFFIVVRLFAMVWQFVFLSV